MCQLWHWHQSSFLWHINPQRLPSSRRGSKELMNAPSWWEFLLYTKTNTKSWWTSRPGNYVIVPFYHLIICSFLVCAGDFFKMYKTYTLKKPTPGLPCSMWRQRVILPARRITETVYTEADTERSERQSGILKQQQIHTVLPKMLNGSYHFVDQTSHLKMLDFYLIWYQRITLTTEMVCLIMMTPVQHRKIWWYKKKTKLRIHPEKKVKVKFPFPHSV